MCYNFAERIHNVIQATRNKTIKAYADPNGKKPFVDWLFNLRDPLTRKRILARIGRLELGHYGDVAPIGGGLSELRIFCGPGYRVYFGEDNDEIVILLCGGDKDSQSRDIKTAHAYWEEYKNHANLTDFP